MSAWFTEQELVDLTEVQLMVVAEYFRVDAEGKSKETVIAEIQSSWEGDDAEDMLSPMSEQVRRIYESMKKEESS
jgi:hypothetical protein